MSGPGADTAAGEQDRDVIEVRLRRLGGMLDSCLLADRPRLGRRLKALRARLRKGEPPADIAQLMGRLADAVDTSVAVCRARAAAPLHIEFPPGLPVSAHIDELGRLINQHQVVIVSGATGSGKSTQLPKLCLALGRGIAGRIGHTQPRRIAARAIARRIAEETTTVPGSVVGHCVRFDDTVGPHARLKVMTDGILLHEITTDPWLRHYDTIIIDEVHERSLNIDVLLGYLKRVLERRCDLRLIITSATMDASAFQAFYADAAVLEIPGRGFPVELRYRAPEDPDDSDSNAALVDTIRELDHDSRGDVLVFLPGEREIREAHRVLARAGLPDTEILDLYARLSSARQGRIFNPGAARRIILATNVAETSLTVPRVRHVVDFGLARVSRYSPRRKLQQLPIEKIARANADQRLGRCGREAPGICVRLYSEADFAARRAAIEPELLRTNLAGVILRLKAMGIDDIESFPFAERPADRLLKDGYNVLQEIGALDAERVLTPIGARLNRFPLDPRLGRVLLAAADLGCLREALIITAALSIADPRDRPHELREQADRAHAEFADKRSDFMWFVRAWPQVRELVALPAGRRARRCRRLFLSPVRMLEWVQLHQFLLQRVRTEKLSLNREPAGYKQVHCALLAGFPSFIGEWQGDHYSGCRNASFALHPSSILYRRDVKWLLAGEIVETARPYARLAARIDPQWVDSVAGHLVRRTYELPHFDPRRGQARVTEIQRLFGLVINANRLRPLEPIDPVTARRLFIEAALVDGDLGEAPDFLVHNLALVRRIGELEARARRRDLLALGATRAAFYDRRIPEGVCTRRALLRWLRAAPENAATLYMDETDATQAGLDSVPAYLFPDTLHVAGSDLTLTYRFAPGTAVDGVTVVLPLVLLPAIQASDFDRLVPGLLSAKVEAMLRGLPKTWRRVFSPVREFAMAAVEALQERPGALDEELAACLANMTGRDIPVRLFRELVLEPHLYFRIELVDEAGEVVATGRDIEQLRAACARPAAHARAALDFDVDGRSSGPWSFGDLPEQVTSAFGGIDVHAYPALRDAGDAVEVTTVAKREVATLLHRDGVVRLLWLNLGREIRQWDKQLPAAKERALYAAQYGYGMSLVAACVEAECRELVAARSEVRNATAFTALCAAARIHIGEVVDERLRALTTLITRGATLRRQFDERVADIPAPVQADIESELHALLGPLLPVALASGRDERYARYLKAMRRRLDRIVSNPGKDQQKLSGIAPLWQHYLALPATAKDSDAASASLDLLLAFEEWRMALFAPELKPAGRPDPADLAARLGMSTTGVA